MAACNCNPRIDIKFKNFNCHARKLFQMGVAFQMNVNRVHPLLSKKLWVYVFYFTDIDECKQKPLPNCGKNSKCVNTIGSYMCKCNIGFAKNTTTKMCEGKMTILFLSLVQTLNEIFYCITRQNSSWVQKSILIFFRNLYSLKIIIS